MAKQQTRVQKTIKRGAASTTSGGYTKRRTSTKPDRSGVGRSGRYVDRNARYRDIRAALGMSTG